MSGLFVDNDGKMSWTKVGYRARSAFAVCLSLAVLIGGGWFVLHKVSTAYKDYKATSDYPGPGGAAVTVTIPAGATENQIGRLLVKADVVKSSKAFVSAADDSAGNAAKFQAGEWRLRKQIPAATAVSMLLDAKNRVVRQFTLPEGLWASDALAIISKKTGIPLAQLQKASTDKSLMGLPSWAINSNYPEGFLFPDTYEYDANPTAAEVLGAVTDEFNQVMKTTQFTSSVQSFSYSYKGVSVKPTPLQVLTIASILEAEVPAKYQAEVAGVLYNRIASRQTLGLDSSLHYAFKVPMNKLLPANATKTPNPFNTYLNAGYPPGPIDSPGKVAINNALHPTTTNNLYFVTINFKTGETRFSVDQKGQDANKKLLDSWCKTNNYPSGCAKS